MRFLAIFATTMLVKDRGVNRLTDRLAGQNVAVGVCGGIGAVEIVKVIRELRRHGAEVYPFLTPSSLEFITETSVAWAANRPPVVSPNAEVGHLEAFDLALVAPMTLNTLAKMAQGLSDNAVTLMVASHLGRKRPMLVVPTMNQSLWAHPLVGQHLGRLKEWGAIVYEQDLEEDRLKMPESISLVEFLLAKCVPR